MFRHKIYLILVAIPVMTCVLLGSSGYLSSDALVFDEDGGEQLVPKVSLSPTFLETPMDLTVNNNTGGYYLEWNVTDDNPDYYVITRNDTGEWETGLWDSGIFRYNLPMLDIGIYNFTLRMFDEFGESIVDNVTITSTELGLPEIYDLHFFQGGKIVPALYCGGGPFSMTFKNSTSLNLTITGTATNENLDLQLGLSSLGIDDLGEDATILIVSESLAEIPGSWQGAFWNNTSPELIYAGDSFNLTPSANNQYLWMASLYYPSLPIDPTNPLPILPLAYVNLTDIQYGITNIFTIEVNEGVPFVCNGSAYDWNANSPCRIEIENHDITAPIYDFEEGYKAVNTGYEISISCSEQNPSESGVLSVVLYYSVNDGDFIEKDMLEYLGLWGCVIPKQDDAVIKYYFVITDEAGNFVQTPEFSFNIAKEEGISSGIIAAIISIGVAFAMALFLSIIFRGTTNVVIKKVEGLQ